jgi:alpha-galactosidase
MKKLLILFFSLSFFNVFAQTLIQYKTRKVLLDNGQISREIVISGDSVSTSFIKLNSEEKGLVNVSPDFSFLLNDKEYSGYSGWKLLSTEEISDQKQGTGKRINLLLKTGSVNIQLEINYLLYPDLPIIRKWITFKNIGGEDFKIENLNIENLQTNLDYIHSMVYHNYARMKHLMKFEGSWDDPIVVVHDMGKQSGIALGNEAIGVIKRSAFHTERGNIEIGLSHLNQDYPFRKWLKPGETWESPKTFIALYSEENDGFSVVNNEVNKFITKHIAPRVIQLPQKPVFVYNTWYPFRTHINDSLIRSVAKSAAECGIEEFIIDDGWQVNSHGKSSIRGWGENYGDWLVDKNKFPNGLKPVFDYIKSLGMKPGLWISIGSAPADSKVFQDHPEWFVKNEAGNPGNLHFASEEQGFYTASFSTEWKDYIKNKILGLVKEHGLAYAKLDLAVVCSPYVNNNKISGSFANDQPLYRDQYESYGIFYNRMLEMFDELHEEAPELFIDCTFETAGKLHMMDYAIAKHAEGNWLSNIEDPSPVGPLRVRHLAWWRSPAMPASSLVIGNLPMDDPDFMFGFKSLIGTLPIVLGDPRELPKSKREEIFEWAEWLRKMQSKHDYMSYRKDLPGFGEPAEGHWDGWQRLNFENKKGGVVGVFRQGAKEESRMVFLTDLIEDKTYKVNEAPNGEKIHQATGEELREKGFPVQIEKTYGGRIFEITME